MPLQPPRQLSTWLEGMQRRNVAGITVPRLYGSGTEEYGIDLPPSHEFESSGPTYAANLLSERAEAGKLRAPMIDRTTGKSYNIPAEAAPETRPPTRQDFMQMYIEQHGDPQEFDVLAETAKTMEEEKKKIGKNFGLTEDFNDPKYLSKDLKIYYNKAVTEKEGEVAKLMAKEKERKIKHFETVMKMFDEQEKAYREERRVRVAEAAERRQQAKQPNVLEQARNAFINGMASPEQVKLLKIPALKPEYTPGKALEKIATLQKAKSSFNKTGKIDAIIAKMFPEYTEGQKLSGPEIKRVTDAYDRAIEYVNQFTPTGKTALRNKAIEELQAAGKPITEANIEYVMEQL